MQERKTNKMQMNETILLLVIIHFGAYFQRTTGNFILNIHIGLGKACQRNPRHKMTDNDLGSTCKKLKSFICLLLFKLGISHFLENNSQ